MRKYDVTVVTAADGSATAYTPTVRGLLEHISYAKTDYAAGVDFTITSEDTGESLWTQADVNASAIVRPRAATHNQSGVAALYASAGTAVNDKIAVNSRIKIVLAQGGNAKTGKFTFFVS